MARLIAPWVSPASPPAMCKMRRVPIAASTVRLLRMVARAEHTGSVQCQVRRAETFEVDLANRL